MGNCLSGCQGKTLVIQEVNRCNHKDCDSVLQVATTSELTHFINRLERISDRLERTVSARALEIANETLQPKFCCPLDLDFRNRQSTTTTKTISSLSKSWKAKPIKHRESKESVDKNSIEAFESVLPPSQETTLTPELRTSSDTTLTISPIECSVPEPDPPTTPDFSDQRKSDNFDLNIPTIVSEFFHSTKQRSSIIVSHSSDNMSVNGYQDILNGPFAQYLQFSNQIGGDVAKHAQVVNRAFNAQLSYVSLATQSAQPSQEQIPTLLKPTSDCIEEIQNFREKNRTSTFFNHLSAISESIPALGWVCVSPTPGPHVKEFNDAGQFYTNRVLKDWKDKDARHVEWARAWVQTLTELQKYIKQYHTTGLVWAGKTPILAGAGAPPPPPAGGPPPPPVGSLPPVGDLSLNDGRSALFAQLNQGEAITKGLKRVAPDQQTHKNTALRGTAPVTGGSAGAGAGQKAVPDKPPVFAKDGKKWVVEYQKNNQNLVIDQADMTNVVYAFKCENSILTVKGKINSIFVDSCKKFSVVFDSVVSSIEFVNCQSVQMQVINFVPTVSIDKTDGCQMYISNESRNVTIITSKSSEMNVLLPKGNGDYIEYAVPEQFKTTIKANGLSTIANESLG